MDYKKSLNLPKTKFSMKANLTNREPEQLKSWEENDLYGMIRKASAGRKKFILHLYIKSTLKRLHASYFHGRYL